MSKYEQYCPGCKKRYTWPTISIHMEEYNTYDQLWYTCKRCGTSNKICFRHVPDRELSFNPRCPWNEEVDYAVSVTTRIE